MPMTTNQINKPTAWEFINVKDPSQNEKLTQC